MHDKQKWQALPKKACQQWRAFGAAQSTSRQGLQCRLWVGGGWVA
jgi:hypothetical protein